MITELQEPGAPKGLRIIDKHIDEWQCFVETAEIQLRHARPGCEEDRAKRLLAANRSVFEALTACRKEIDAE